MTPSPTGSPARRLVRHGRLALLAAVSGALVGAACWVFLECLDRATRTRLDHDVLVWFLPVAGLLVGLVYHAFGGRSHEGTGLLLQEIHEPTAWVPRRLAPLVAGSAVVSHLVGASVGREGTALQLSGSLTDLVSRTCRVGREDRRVLLIAALGGGFGAVFGAPWAGLVFGLEVQWVRRIRLRGPIGLLRTRATPPLAGPGDALGGLTPFGRFRTTPNGRLLAAVVPTAIAAQVASAVVAALGHAEGGGPRFDAAFEPALLVGGLAIGVAAGLAALAFVELAEGIRHRVDRVVTWPPLRPFAGGVVVLGLAGVAGHGYLGLSLPMIDAALAGLSTAPSVPAWKLLITAVCLGCGFVGGEVTPLFVVGATLGGAVGDGLGLGPALGAAIGFSAAFAGAANAPVACTVLAVEVFGPGISLPAAIACTASFVVSGRWGLYHRRPDDEPSLAGRARRLAPTLDRRRTGALHRRER